MNYFITGGTGFIGHNLIKELLKKKKQATIYVLLKPFIGTLRVESPSSRA